MPALNPLGALLARFLGLGPVVRGLDEVRALRELVESLEGEQLRRETEWRETKDQLYRHLKRVQSIEAKAGGARSDPMERARARALQLKLDAGGSQ